MLNAIHLPSGSDLSLASVLLALLAVVAVAALVVLGAYLLRRPGAVKGAMWGGTLVMTGVLISSILPGGSGDTAAERRAIQAREAELTMRAIAPGSALACLDAVANFDVEIACEKALFTSPETVAAALAYIDARISLLAAATALAKRDSTYRPPFERMRHAIEVDRFGLSAQVLMTRGCDSPRCPDFKLLRNPGPILANMKGRTFDNHVSTHASAWSPSGASMATASLPPTTVTMPQLAVTPPAATTGTAHGVPVPSRFDFPSAASIPAVSIMNAEPSAPPGGEPPEARSETQATPTPPRRPQASPRRQSAGEAQPRSSAPPLSVVPPTAAPQPQTSATR